MSAAHVISVQMTAFDIAVVSLDTFIRHRILSVHTLMIREAFNALAFFFGLTGLVSVWSLILISMLSMRAIRRRVNISQLIKLILKWRHVKLFIASIRGRSFARAHPTLSPSPPIYFLNQRNELFVSKYVALVIVNNDLVKQLSISFELELLDLELIFGNQLEDDVVLFEPILPLIFITQELPEEFRVVHETHHITDFVKVIPPLKHFGALVILLSSPLLLLKKLVSTMLCLLSAHLLLGDSALLLADQLLTPLLCSLFFQMPIVVFALVLFHDLIPPLLSFGHLVVDVELHVIHGHLDYVVCLVDLFDLLLSLITQDFNLGLSALLGLSKLVVEGPLPLS